jgi:hypothetical protein
MFKKLDKDARDPVSLVKVPPFLYIRCRTRRSVETGRQVGLKNRWSQGHEGSTPSSGTCSPPGAFLPLHPPRELPESIRRAIRSPLQGIEQGGQDPLIGSERVRPGKASSKGNGASGREPPGPVPRDRPHATAVSTWTGGSIGCTSGESDPSPCKTSSCCFPGLEYPRSHRYTLRVNTIPA